jgi:hypothetical protein
MKRRWSKRVAGAMVILVALFVLGTAIGQMQRSAREAADLAATRDLYCPKGDLATINGTVSGPDFMVNHSVANVLYSIYEQQLYCDPYITQIDQTGHFSMQVAAGTYGLRVSIGRYEMNWDGGTGLNGAAGATLTLVAGSTTTLVLTVNEQGFFAGGIRAPDAANGTAQYEIRACDTAHNCASDIVHDGGLILGRDHYAIALPMLAACTRRDYTISVWRRALNSDGQPSGDWSQVSARFGADDAPFQTSTTFTNIASCNEDLGSAGNSKMFIITINPMEAITSPLPTAGLLKSPGESP